MKKQKIRSNGAENNPPANSLEPQPAANEKVRISADTSPGANNETQPAEVWTEEELDVMSERAAKRAPQLDNEYRRIGFAYGRIAFENHEEVLNGSKRVPDNEDTYKRLSKKIARLGIRTMSANRLRALAKAYHLYVALGGEGKAPSLSPDHYVEAAREGLTIEQKREVLETAFEKGMNSGRVRDYALAKLKELGTEPVRDEAYWHDWLDKSISRFESGITETRMKVTDQEIEISSCTRDHLNYLAVYIYQFANQCGPEGVK